MSEATSARIPRVATPSQENNREPSTKEEAMHMSESVRCKLSHWLKQAPLLTESTIEEESDSEEMGVRQKFRKTIKSGKVRTADATIVKRITWPHKLIYTARGQPAVYDRLTIHLFVSGYLAVLDSAGLSFGIPSSGVVPDLSHLLLSGS